MVADADLIIPQRRRARGVGHGGGHRQHRQAGHARPPFRVNLTSLIDVTFLLIVFFVLVAEITRTQIAEEIELPQPDPSAASERDPEATSLILNLVPGDDRQTIREYRVAGRSIAASDPAALDELTAWLRDLASTTPGIPVELRADRDADYRSVYPVMKAISAAGIVQVELVVSEPDPATDAATAAGSDRPRARAEGGATP